MFQPVGGVIGEAMKVLRSPDSDYGDFLVYALWFMREYKCFVEIKPMPFFLEADEIPDSFCIDRPTDMIAPIRVGYVENPGTTHQKIIERSEDKSMGRISRVDAAPENPPISDSEGGFDSGNYYGNGSLYGTAWAPSYRGPLRGSRPADLLGTWIDNTKDGVIQLKTNVHWPNFYMDYKSDCIEYNEDMIVHPYAQNPLIDHILDQHAQIREKSNFYSLRAAKSKKGLPGRLNPIDWKVMIDAADSYRGYTH